MNDERDGPDHHGKEPFGCKLYNSYNQVESSFKKGANFGPYGSYNMIGDIVYQCECLPDFSEEGCYRGPNFSEEGGY